ncbi:MAG: hypothetical protein R3F56_04690 [Planctomycetota bacterium]
MIQAILNKCIATVVVSVGLAAQSDPLVGTFRDERTAIRVAEPASGSDGYQGTIVLDGKTYPFTATGTGRKLAGHFTVGTVRFPFEAEVVNDALEFATGSKQLQLRRVGAVQNPFDEPAADRGTPHRGGDADAPAAPPAPEAAAGQTVQHPGGFALRVPDGWQSQLLAGPVFGSGVLMATPAGSDPDNPEAMFMVTTVPLTGPFAAIERPDDPRLRELGLLPQLAATAPARSAQLPLGPASLTEYRGSLAPGQGDVRARLHVLVLGKRLVTCFAVADAAVFDRHDVSFRALEQGMRGTPAQGAAGIPDEVRLAPRDPRLVGTWRNTTSRVLTGLPSESTAISTDVFCTLAADGRYRYGAGQTGFAATTRSGTGTGITGRGEVETGYWKTVGNVLYRMQEGTGTWTPMGQRYAVSGDAVLVYFANGHKVLWER